jgi:hypothetical protein
MKNIWFISTIKIYFEHDDELGKYNYHRGTIMNRDDISKFDYFDEEWSYYFDFTIFVGDIFDIILYMDYSYINDDEK